MGSVTRTRHRIWTSVTDGTAPGDVHGAATAVRGLRRRRDKDLRACVRLLRVVHYESRYPFEWPESPRNWLSDDKVLDAWVVERWAEILGHVAVAQVGDGTVSAYRWRETTGRQPTELAAVTRLFVRPPARRQGVGTALLEAAVSEIRARGRLPVLEILDCNQDAIRLCESQGWRLLSMDPWGDRSLRRRVHCYAAPPDRR
jgi:GNAT superfamily N-acetyltransferase